MSANKPNISQIRKYLNGELDDRAMHELERQALDDPFLLDALEGYQNSGKDQQANIHELNKRLHSRTASSKKRITLWPAMSIAASVLLFIAVGGWWLVHNKSQINTAKEKDNTVVVARPPVPAPKEIKSKSDPAVIQQNYTSPEFKPVQSLSKAKVRTGKPNVDDFGKSSVRIDEPVGNAPVSAAFTEAAAMDSSLALAGRTGNNETIRIRGKSSLNVANKPLYIVDGKIYNDKIDDINSADIKGIEVLKDASATALYGSRAANGAIIITTKNGKFEKSKLDSDLIAKNSLKEVLGYETQQKTSTAGSGNTVTPVPMEQALAGRVAGVTVTRGKKRKAADTLKIITGQVLGKSDGLPLPGVSVVIAGKNKGVITDANGKFKIEASANDELSIRYLGYVTKSLKVKAKDSLKVRLEESHQALSEVTVVSQPAEVIEEAHPSSGWNKFNKYLQQETADAEETGVVRLSFVVNPDKTLNNFKIIKSLSAGADQQAIAIIKNGPQWVPNANGQPETVKLRIRFKK